MKDGTHYADRLKKAYAKLRREAESKEIPDSGDPIRCLALGILGSESGPDRAERQLGKALGTVVDWNEIRVSSAQELAGAMGEASADILLRCQNLISALQNIYDRENKVSLDRLKSLGRREARQYLEALKGVDEYAVACVVLWSLGGHAIPVCNQALSALRQAELVHPTATRAEVQAFMERNVSAADARAFAMMLGSFGSKRSGSAGKRVAATKNRKREAAK